MRARPRSSEESEGTTNYHAKDATMFPGFVAAKPLPLPPLLPGKDGRDWEEEAERHVDFVFVLGFLERPGMTGRGFRIQVIKHLRLKSISQPQKRYIKNNNKGRTKNV